METFKTLSRGVIVSNIQFRQLIQASIFRRDYVGEWEAGRPVKRFL